MGKRIIVIDDDIFIRELYEEVLKNEGYDVTVAEDGETGLSKLLEGGFSAVLLDVMMPKLDGIGVLTKLKESPPKKPNGPILLLTNLDHDPMLEKAKELGASQYLLKADVLPPKLIELVKNAVAASSAAPQPVQ